MVSKEQQDAREQKKAKLYDELAKIIVEEIREFSAEMCRGDNPNSTPAEELESLLDDGDVPDGWGEEVTKRVCIIISDEEEESSAS